MAAIERRYGPPLKLYDLSMNRAVINYLTACNCKECVKEHHFLPNTVLSDFYEKLFYCNTTKRRFVLLAFDFKQIDIINRLLYVKAKRTVTLSLYHKLNYNWSLNGDLIQAFSDYAVKKKGNRPVRELIDMGLRIASFLNEGGWYFYTIYLLKITESLIRQADELATYELLKLLECYRLKLHAEAQDCRFAKAKKTYRASKRVLSKLNELNALPNLARIYASFSAYKFVICEYNSAYSWGMKALDLITTDLNIRVTIEVLRQASKACVVKRKFPQAGFLIRQAMILGDTSYMKEQRHFVSDILMDYGFYLLNSDAVRQSVDMYEKAFSLKKSVFDEHNIHLATCLEDLAYAVYVCEYSTGNFLLARVNAEKAIEYMERILPKDHLRLASAKRVKALILEEIAIDSQQVDEKRRKELLDQAEELHLTALRLCQKSLGEENVQTAKHYGNLGRLYESKKQYEEAEKMFLRAIAIKEKKLGSQDYEVGLSVSHLASLYNHNMKKYEEAEKLHLRSIEISFTLFGPAYSGLEYDYKGLVFIAARTGDTHKYLYYRDRYGEWLAFRQRTLFQVQRMMSPKNINKMFFELCRCERVLVAKRAQVARRIVTCDRITKAEIEKVLDPSSCDSSEIDSLSDQTSLLDLNETGSSQSDSDDEEEDEEVHSLILMMKKKMKKKNDQN